MDVVYKYQLVQHVVDTYLPCPSNIDVFWLEI